MVGGLMGCSRNSVVENCYATGDVSCMHRGAASLLGSVFGSNVSNCYATGNTKGGGQEVTNFGGDREAGSSYENCYAIGTTTDGAQTYTPSVTNCWTLSGTKSFMLGFKEGSAADIKAAFTGLEGWDTSGTYPTLTGIGVVSDTSKYQPGAVTEAPSTNTGDSANGGATTGDSTTVVEDSQGESQEALLAKFIEAVNSLPETLNKDNWKALIDAQIIYDKISEDTLVDLPTEVRSKFLNAKVSIQEEVLLTLKEEGSKLPSAKKVKASDKENIEYLYNLYTILPEAAQGALDPEIKDNLLACYEAVGKFEDSEAAASANLTAPEIILVIVLSVLICCAIAFCIFNNVKTYKLLKKVRESDEEDEDLENE